MVPHRPQTSVSPRQRGQQQRVHFALYRHINELLERMRRVASLARLGHKAAIELVEKEGGKSGRWRRPE